MVYRKRSVIIIIPPIHHSINLSFIYVQCSHCEWCDLTMRIWITKTMDETTEQLKQKSYNKIGRKGKKSDHSISASQLEYNNVKFTIWKLHANIHTIFSFFSSIAERMACSLQLVCNRILAWHAFGINEEYEIYSHHVNHGHNVLLPIFCVQLLVTSLLPNVFVWLLLVGFFLYFFLIS